MRQRYRLFRRAGGNYYLQDNTTGRQETLRTRDRARDQRLLHARNEAHQQPAINLQIARAYLMTSDPLVATRTWQFVMEQIVQAKQGDTRHRWTVAVRDKCQRQREKRKGVSPEWRLVKSVVFPG